MDPRYSNEDYSDTVTPMAELTMNETLNKIEGVTGLNLSSAATILSSLFGPNKPQLLTEKEPEVECAHDQMLRILRELEKTHELLHRIQERL